MIQVNNVELYYETIGESRTLVLASTFGRINSATSKKAGSDGHTPRLYRENR
jgi:hypothetical protein